MNRYASGKFTGQFKATIGADFLTKDVVITDSYGQRHLVTLQIWDTAEQERFQSLGVGFYRGSDGVILVYDVTDPSSLEHLDHWQTEFLNQVGPVMNGPFPFIVLGNKVDKERRIPKEAAEQWCQRGVFAYSNQMTHMDTSAKSAANVDEAFEEIARLALNYEDYKRRSQPQLFIPPANASVDLRLPAKPEKETCC